MPAKKPLPHSTRVLRLRLKDKHAPALRDLARDVNFVWNYANDLSFKVWQRERRFMGEYDIDKYTAGATREGLNLHSTTVQAISKEFVTRRKQFKKVKLRWRVSGGARRSLGWIPFKASALRYRNGQVLFSTLDKRKAEVGEDVNLVRPLMSKRKSLLYRYRWHRGNDRADPLTAAVLAFLCWLRFGE
jgi:putative transposase